MLRGMYTAASGMIAQQRQQELLTNNMTNANTPGYKVDQGSLRTFPSMLIANLSQTGDLPVSNELATGTYLQESIPNFMQGDLMETENKTDIAIVNSNLPEEGTLVFAIETDEGIQYTRNGNFTINSEGTLVTSQGYPILDVNGNAITVNDQNFQLRANGTIVEADAPTAQIDVLFAENAHDLVKAGNGLLSFAGEGEELGSAIGQPDVDYQLQQGFIERSNVNVEQTMTDMMQAYRSFEVNQRVLQAYDKSLEKAVNEIGRL